MTTRKAELLRYGTLGLVTFALGLSMPWLRVSGASGWLRILSHAMDVVPWLIGAGLLVLAILRKRWMPLIAFAGSQFLAIATMIGLIFGGPVLSDYVRRTSFDSAKWKAENRRGAEAVRVRMVDDLLRHHTLVGMQRTQLEELLGVPPPTPYFSEYDYVYWLGPERGAFSIDSEWLVVRCDRDVVVVAKVVTD
jgi:hypothetical protein